MGRDSEDGGADAEGDARGDAAQRDAPPRHHRDDGLRGGRSDEARLCGEGRHISCGLPYEKGRPRRVDSHRGERIGGGHPDRKGEAADDEDHEQAELGQDHAIPDSEAQDPGPRCGAERLLPEACRSRRGDEEEGRVLKATVSKKYVSREAITYYALSLPAIALQLFFSSSVAANQGQFTPQVASFGPGITELVQLLPWGLLALSILAVVRFRPSALVTLLTASFFLAAAALGESGFFGTALGLTGSVSLVILATFMALIGFNYARAAKLLGGRPALVEGKGPLGYQLLSTSLELVLPLLAAVALAVGVSAIVTTLTLHTKLLPEPLSTLSSLYVESRFGLVFVSIGVAGDRK